MEFLLMQFQCYSLQPTIGIKNPLQILLCKCSEKIETCKVSKIWKEPLENCPFISNISGMRPRIFDSTKKILSKKNVSCECSEIVGNLLGKGLYWSHFYKVTLLLSIIYTLLKTLISHIFQGRLQKFPEQRH